MRKSLAPPNIPGSIYVVIDYKPGGDLTTGNSLDTTVSVRWGSFNKSEVKKVPNMTKGHGLYHAQNFWHVVSRWNQAGKFESGVPFKGFVLQLKHEKKDSVLLTVSTDGVIVKGPYQGSPPAEWNDINYSRESW